MYQVNTSKSRKKMKNKMEVPERRCREIDKKKITKICRDPHPQQLLIFFLCKIKIVVIEGGGTVAAVWSEVEKMNTCVSCGRPFITIYTSLACDCSDASGSMFT